MYVYNLEFFKSGILEGPKISIFCADQKSWVHKLWKILSGQKFDL